MAGLLIGNNISSPRKGLLGLGGFGGSQPPAGLLGPFYDPAEERRRKISGAMTQAGLALLTNGKGSFGEVLGQGLAAGLQGAQLAGLNYKSDMLGYNKLAMDMEAQKEKQEEKQRLMDWVNSQPPEMQNFLAVNPESGAKLWQEYRAKSMFPEPMRPTGDQREYEMARQQGYQGTFQQYMIEMKKAGASNVNVNGDQKLTEGQSKDLGFYSRGIYANSELDKNEQALLSLGGNYAGKAGVVGNYFKDPKYRQAERSGREVLAVILRKDTGAAVTPAEFELYGPMYLPWPGDDAQTLADKREARARALQGIRLGGGTARPLYDEIDQQFQTVNPPINQAPRSPSPMGTGKTSNGVPWKVLE